MARTDAMELGAGWFGARTAGSSRQRRRQSPLRSLGRYEPTGHARLLAAPTYRRLLQSEASLRRVIPVLVLGLLLMVIAARAVIAVAAHDAIERTATDALHLSAALTAERLLDQPGLEDVEDDPLLARAALAASFTPTQTHPGRRAVLATSAGRLLTIHPANLADDPALASLPPLLPDETIANRLPRLLVELSGRPDVRRVPLDEGTVLLAVGRDVAVLPSGQTLRLLMVDEEATLYAGWWRETVVEIVMLAMVAAGFGALLLAYLRQFHRTRQGDALYRETQNRFNTALIRGHCGMWDWDLARGRIFWSPSMFEILGREASDELMSLSDITPLVHPGDVDLITMGNDVFASAGNSIDRRFRMKRASGEWTWLRIRAELVSYNGSDPHLVGIAVDISEQEALERQSERADTRLRDAVEAISEAFVLWDSRRRLVLGNSKFRQFYGVPKELLEAGTRFEDVEAHAQEAVTRHEAKDLRVLEAGASTREVQLEDGRWLQVAERRTKDGGLVSVQTDISQIKRNQEKLQRSEAQLKATVADLEQTQAQQEETAQHMYQLAQECLEAQKKAEAGNLAKSKFLANMSHELRTPLNAILGFSDIMTSQLFGPIGSAKYAEYAGDIHQSGEFLLGVVNDVLDMSKIEAGRFQIDPEPLDLADTIDESLRVVGVQAEEKALNVRRDVPDHVPVEADRRALKQILINLLSNAVKFTPKGGTIRVRVRQRDDAVHVAIADTGCGIAPEALARVGVPFEQAQNEFTRNHEGSGLGLAIARSLAELHGGTLELRSAVDKGTVVLVRLPLTQGRREAEDQTDEMETDEAIARAVEGRTKAREPEPA